MVCFRVEGSSENRGCGEMEVHGRIGVLWLLTKLLTAAAHIQPSLLSLTITRHHQGDLFLAQGKQLTVTHAKLRDYECEPSGAARR